MKKVQMQSFYRIFTFLLTVTLLVFLFTAGNIRKNIPFIFSGSKKPKLYWFIPDGTRADPKLFTVFQWAKEGKLPHIKKMMEEGVYGYSLPDFPSHTPTNFASLFTGTSPRLHGIADGPMHTEGHLLNRPSVAGFSSTAKWIPPIWTLMEELGKKVILLSLPGSTPPELQQGITIRGRWGGWGFDTYKVIFEPESMLEKRKKYGNAFKLFFLGSKLTRFVKQNPIKSAFISYSPPLKSLLQAHGSAIHAEVVDNSNDRTQNYNQIFFYLDEKSKTEEMKSIKNSWKISLKQGEWSSWLPISLKYKDLDVDSHVKIKLISLQASGIFRVRILYNNINKFITEPDFVASDITSALGAYG